MKKIIIFVLIFYSSFLFSVVEETESLTNFLYGNAPGCQYDNWMSHITEGIADPGYNLYAPWDVQSNGFGNFTVPSDIQLVYWNDIVISFLVGSLDAAQSMIDNYGFPYQVVIFHDEDTEKTFHLLREIPNPEYYDDNETDDPGDDEHGAFDYGWGLYIHYPEGQNPHITTAPHPNDDYITLPIAHKTFIEHESKFLLVSGAGREVVWTNSGYYNNSKSLCDPSRVEDHPFNVCYQNFCNYIRDEFGTYEFSLQIHSYDWGDRHWGYPNVQISAGYYEDSPDLPIRDLSNLKNDIVNAGEEIIHPANTVGMNQTVHLNEFYGFHCSEYDFTFSNEDTTFAVNTNIDLWGYSQNRQLVYTQSGMSEYDNFERFMHLEMDELPNIYPQTVNNYHWFNGWNTAQQKWNMLQRFDYPLAYYSPWIESLKEVLPALYEMDDNIVPFSPSNLEITTECSDQVKLEWTIGDCYDMESYEILHSTEPISNNNYSIIDRDNVQQLACLAHDNYHYYGLTPGEERYFAVRIRDKNGNYSEISNEVIGTGGPTAIDGFAAYGRDTNNEIYWESSSNTAFSGFNIYRKTQDSDYILLDSWVTNGSLIGMEGANILYTFYDDDVEYGVLYTYKISMEDSDEEYFYDIEKIASPETIYQLKVTQEDGPESDVCYFGFNYGASDYYDVHYDFSTVDSTTGNYFFCQFYEEYWDNVPTEFEQELHSKYDTDQQLKNWTFRFRTNQTGQPVIINIPNLDRNTERIYLSLNGNLTNLATDEYLFTPATTGFYYFDLYFGNLTPNLTFSDFANQLLYPNETAHFEWSLDLQSTIDHINIYAENEEITIPIELEQPPSTNEVDWLVPQLLFEDLGLKIDLVMIEGDTLSYFSTFKFGIISPQNIVQTYQGWNLITKNFDTDLYSSDDIYGIGTVFHQFLNNEFQEVEDPEFLQPYWLFADQDNYFVLNNAVMQQTAIGYEMHNGWNNIPNPHKANYDLTQLKFSINNSDFEYYEAVQNGLIEPIIFEYNNSFMPVDHLQPAKSYYLYCYENNVTVKFIPYYNNIYSPEFEYEWKVVINAEQQNYDSSSIIVGTSSLADSLYDPNYDYLKPLDKPYANSLTFSLPMNIAGSMLPQELHQSITKPKDTATDFSYAWDAKLQLTDLEPLVLSADEFELPGNHNVYLQIAGSYLDLSENENVEFMPTDSLMEFSIIVTNDELVIQSDEIVASSYSLQNYPNPFNPSAAGAGRSPTTTIEFSIENDSQVELTVFNIRGQKVKILLDEYKKSGVHQVEWNGVDKFGKKVASGVYFYRLQTKGRKPLTKKMLLLK